MPKKVTPFLWYDEGKAQQAAAFYTKIFRSSRIIEETPMGVTFQLDGQEIIAFNGGPLFKFNEAASLFVSCRDQKEVDYYLEQLTAHGGEPGRCGWLKDKFGLSWQVVPDCLASLLTDPDRAKADRAMKAMMTMQKLDIAALQKAHAGK